MIAAAGSGSPGEGAQSSVRPRTAAAGASSYAAIGVPNTALRRKPVRVPPGSTTVTPIPKRCDLFGEGFREARDAELADAAERATRVRVLPSAGGDLDDPAPWVA